ncbi:hypothetical protein RUM44_002247 [Polyplax serrata]|uniref:G-protein coupled receptors family 1 profile domain-containing protein n=1 Tax=Polyplax serrata TaxID=468196 RepID=A0ABR1AMC4_POLSC
MVTSNPIVCMTDYTHLEYVDGSNVSVCQTLADTFWSKTFFLGGTLVFFALPLAILVMLYSVIAINLMTHPGIIPLRRLENPTSAQRYRKKVVMMLGTVVTFFFVCLLPFRALIVWIVLAPHEEVMKLGNEGYYSLLYFCRIMFYLNSATNPILYNLMSSKFRNGFLKLCGIKKNYFRKHKKGLLRTSTFNTSSLTAITTSSIHRPSIADLNHHHHHHHCHKDRKKSFLDTSYKTKDLVDRRDSCSKSLLFTRDFDTDTKAYKLKGFMTRGAYDRKKTDRCHFRLSQSNRKKVDRRKSFSDFLLVDDGSPLTPVRPLKHSQSMDSIFKKKTHHHRYHYHQPHYNNNYHHQAMKKAHFRTQRLAAKVKEEFTGSKKPVIKPVSGSTRSDSNTNSLPTNEEDRTCKIFNSSIRGNKMEEFKESLV